MKKIMIILLLLTIAIGSVSAQSKFVSPQTILWNLEEAPIGNITFMVYLAPMSISPTNRTVDNMLFISEVSNLSALIDVESTGLQGNYAVAIQTHRIWEDIDELTTFAFSDVAADADPIDGPFFLQFVKGASKPKRVKVR
jgi:hypothetical protein